MKFSLIKFTLILLLTYHYTNGQEFFNKQKITCIDTARNYLYEIDLTNSTFMRFDSKGKNLNQTIKFKEVKFVDIPAAIDNNYFPLAPDLFLITINGTGQVYIFDVKLKLLERIDKTFYRGNNFGAIQFSRKDTIFSVGGKGFWRVHNIPIVFNKKLKEWDYFNKINENGPKGISADMGGYDNHTDCIYSLENPPLYTEKKDSKYAFFTFNFKNSNWKENGIVNFNDPNLKNFTKQKGKWIAPFFFSEELGHGEFIDPAENKIYRYQGLNRSFFLLTKHFYVKANRIYAFQRTYNQNKFEIKLDSLDIETLKKESVVLGEFYIPSVWYNEINWSNYWYIGIIFILLFLNFYQLKNQKQKTRDIWNQLPPEAISILKFMLKKPNFICTSDELNTILNCSEKSIESQRQYRSKFIVSINQFFERNFELQDAVIRNQSEFDKRFVTYQLNQLAAEISKQC
jgi:hypothetical protein